MTLFATEFPVRPGISPGQFVAQIVAWLRGTEYSTVLDGAREIDLDHEAPVLRAASGEELRLRIFRSQEQEAFGFRHDFPDSDGRLWRTEAVLRRSGMEALQDIIRLRTQCIARQARAPLETPRKPYLLKSILRDKWGATDRLLPISDAPIWLTDDEAGLELASSATSGKATDHLPVVYVSTNKRSLRPFSPRQIEKLAYDLGGVAHVVAEPTRSFSFRLRDLTAGRNVYGGTIGIALPERGIVKRAFVGGQVSGLVNLSALVREAVIDLRSQMPASGWDWTDLQEQALRQQREREKSRLTAEEAEALYEEEIANLKDQIDQLKEQISQSVHLKDRDGDDNLGAAVPMLQAGPEIYPGEHADRLRLAATIALSRSEIDGLDGRSTAVFDAWTKLPQSAGLTEFIEDIRRATRDSSRLASALTSLLERHGYREKAQNKHVLLEPQSDFIGLGSLTVAKTPSDARGLANMRKQVERTLGLTKLKS